MCEHGTTVPLIVSVPANLSSTGFDKVATKPIDACIAPLVATLNAHGFPTAASCCGHGRLPGSIILCDGRELVIARDRAEAQQFFDLFGTTIHGEPLAAVLPSGTTE